MFATDDWHGETVRSWEGSALGGFPDSQATAVVAPMRRHGLGACIRVWSAVNCEPEGRRGETGTRRAMCSILFSI